MNNNTTLIVGGANDGHVFYWNGADNKLITQQLAHSGAVTGVSVHPQNTQLLTGGADGLVKLWALPPVPTRTLTHPDAVNVAVVSADGKKLYTGSKDKIVRTWDLAKNVVEKQYAGHTGPVTAVAISPNGKVLASGGEDGTIRLWNQATGKESEVIRVSSQPITSLAFSPAGDRLISADSEYLLQLRQLPIVGPKSIPHGDEVTTLAVSADGAKLATGGKDKQVRLWNLATGAKERDFSGPTGQILAVALSNDGKLIAAASKDKSITLWNLSDAKVLKKYPLPGWRERHRL